MDTDLKVVAQDCLNAAYDGRMAFPQIVEALHDRGFEGYLVDYRRHTTTYFRPDGESVELENRSNAGSVAANFDAEGVAAQVRWAQAAPAEYSYTAFCRNVQALGCAGYMVSFLGRRVLYFGRTAETHVEHFPQ